MNTGHEGSLTTIHGNSPRDALDRLATLAMMAGERLGGEELARMVSRTIELVVQLRVTVRTGQRRVASIFEVTGVENGIISGHEIWGLDHGRLVWKGRPPRCMDKMLARGRGLRAAGWRVTLSQHFVTRLCARVTLSRHSVTPDGLHVTLRVTPRTDTGPTQEPLP